MKHSTPPALLAALLPLTGLLCAPCPAQGSWTTDSLSSPRTGVGAAVLGDLLMFGGGNIGLTFSDVVDVYHRSTDTWSFEYLSIPRSVMGTTTVGDLAFFAGGSTLQFAPSDRVDVYDAQTGIWTQDSLSVARAGVGATSVGTKALFAGGGGIGFVSDRVDIYDTLTGTWSQATLSQARASVTAVTVGDLAIFAGGSGIQGVPYDTVDIYDDSTGTWSTATLSAPRLLGSEAAAVVGSKVYFAGGHDSFQGGPNMSDALDVYDAQTDTWTATTLSVPRGYIAATALGNNVVLAGGRLTNNVVTDLVETLNTGTGAWGPARALSEARYGAVVAHAGGRAYFAGGVGVGGPANTASDVIDVLEPIGSNYCSATSNSTGVPATISASGSLVAASNDLTLLAVDLPPGQFGYFLCGRTQGSVAPMGSQGTLCLSGNIGRLNGAGQIFQGPIGAVAVDLQALPVNPTRPALAGETWNFQCWYRDANPGLTSNLTDGLSVLFQ